MAVWFCMCLHVFNVFIFRLFRQFVAFVAFVWFLFRPLLWSHELHLAWSPAALQIDGCRRSSDRPGQFTHPGAVNLNANDLWTCLFVLCSTKYHSNSNRVAAIQGEHMFILLSLTYIYILYILYIIYIILYVILYIILYIIIYIIQYYISYCI